MNQIDGHLHSKITAKEIDLWREHPCNLHGDLRILYFREPDFLHGEDPSPLNVINHPRVLNPFGALAPILLDRHSLQYPMQHSFRPQVLLDSNMVSAFSHAYRCLHGESLKEQPNWTDLDPILASRHELSVDYYVYETLSTSKEPGTVLENMRGGIGRIFEISNCDRNAFLQDRHLISDMGVKAQVLEEEGVNTFEELAEKHLEMLFHRWNQGMAGVFERWETGSRILLLKVLLLERERGISLEEKFHRFIEFEQQELGFKFAREEVFAALYLGPLHAKKKYQPAWDFLHKELKSKGLRAKTRGSARDLLLPRFAEKHLTAGLGEGKFVMPRILTRDRALLEISKPIRIHHFFTQSGNTAWSAAYDPDFLVQELNRHVPMEGIHALLQNTPESPQQPKTWRTTEDLKAFLAHLEDRVSRECRIPL